MYDEAYPFWNTDLTPIQDGRVANVALRIGQEERFFNKLEDDVTRIVQQEKRREQYTNSHGQEVVSIEHERVSRQAETHQQTIGHLSVCIMPQVSTVHEQVLHVL